jgi:hypothetical protein
MFVATCNVRADTAWRTPSHKLHAFCLAAKPEQHQPPAAFFLTFLSNSKQQPPARIMSQRGAEIRFVNGTYLGDMGLLDVAKTHTSFCYYIIVQNYKGNGDKPTRVGRASARLLSEEINPVSLKEAILQQHLDIEAAMNKLIALFARYGIQGESTEDPCILLGKLLTAGVAQVMKASKTTWRSTDWETSKCHERFNQRGSRS